MPRNNRLPVMDIMPVLDSIMGGSPFSSALNNDGQAASDQSDKQDGVKGPTMVDSILKTIFGAQESDMTSEELSKKRKKQNEAGQLAASAANGSPGEEFMNAPAAGGSGFGIQDLARLFMGGGK